MEDTTELSFADLIEMRVVKAFRHVGISMQAVRFAISYAEKSFGVTRPLSTMEFRTDGEEILMEAIEQDGEFVSLSKRRPGQKVFAEIVKQSLRDLEYEDGIAARWRPSVAQSVILDPTRQFGAPILDEYGVSTTTLFREFKV
ncbi:MAG: hypothetical protein KGH84_11320, partial [Paracoccaceae bacterium]|nr:hypothetical protein [Paracoccaceae bacterium]